MRATMSIFSLLEANSRLFDGLTVPEGVDKETLVNTILMECAELEVLYASPITMQGLIAIWAKKSLQVWEKLFSTTKYDYDPISNYDRHFTASEDVQKNNSESRDLTDSGTDSKSGTDKHTSGTSGKTVNSGEDTSTVKKSAFNNTAAETIPIDTVQIMKAGQTAETTGKINADDTHEESGTSTLKQTGTIENDEHAQVQRTERAYGNIGVTTTQQMISEEREIVKFNIYTYITEEFKARFCLLVY